MITPIKIRNITIGAGQPKICLPVAGRNKSEMLSSVRQAMSHSPDMIELRCDYLSPLPDDDAVSDILSAVRHETGDTVLIFTFRTKAEGGNLQISFDRYSQLTLAAAQSGFVDLIDIERFSFACLDDAAGSIEDLIKQIKACGVKVIGSNHSFDSTPNRDEIVRRLCEIERLGADISKIAVMPRRPADVLTLLSATDDMRETYSNIPVITMSMSGLGSISRICGEIFGSAVTFGCAGLSSAPGQLEVESLRTALSTIHDNL